MPEEAPHADIVYICSPNNPTGATYSVEQLKAWVDWAKANDAVILFDAAYECFVTEPGLARSIFEVEGAKEVAIEVCSFSKIAGFTGTRCGYTVVPQALAGGKLNKMAAPPDHQVQRRCLRGAARCRGRLYRRGHEGNPAQSGLLPRQRRRDCRRAGRGGHLVLWRQEQPPTSGCAAPTRWAAGSSFDWLLKNAHVVGTPGEGLRPLREGIFPVDRVR